MKPCQNETVPLAFCVTFAAGYSLRQGWRVRVRGRFYQDNMMYKEVAAKHLTPRWKRSDCGSDSWTYF